MTAPQAVLWDVAEEHLDEAEFLVEQWLAAARSPRFSRQQLRKTIEARLLAHLDGLVIGGEEVAERLLWPVLGDGGSPSRVAAAGLALLVDEPGPALPRLLTAMSGGEPVVRSGLVRALQLCPHASIDEPVRLALYAAGAPAEQEALLSVLAARRADPGPIVATLLDGAASPVTRAALAAAASSDRVRHRAAVERYLGPGEAPLRAAALRTALVWNLWSAWQTCLAEAHAGDAQAMLFLSLIEPDPLSVLTAALARPERRAAALFALGCSGTIEAAEACLPWLDDPEPATARLAGEAIAAVTGLPLADLARPPADDADANLPPLDEDLQTSLTPGPVEELPLPDPAKVRAWWAERSASLPRGQRLIAGQALSSASVQSALETGPLRRSGLLAWELAVRSGGILQLPALRLAQPPAMLPPNLPLHRPPAWR